MMEMDHTPYFGALCLKRYSKRNGRYEHCYLECDCLTAAGSRPFYGCLDNAMLRIPPEATDVKSPIKMQERGR